MHSSVARHKFTFLILLFALGVVGFLTLYTNRSSSAADRLGSARLHGSSPMLLFFPTAT